ncbi:predicted protein [Botrytis cinerea T4]|uniref:Uncharacterized protein n=1 Tax=Botryotinia fuckeliana (strain T4) TaxID=999810 RepID=G2Y012_BOTF4|nr:predicted protein [Botrytis cinerea T4]
MATWRISQEIGFDVSQPAWSTNHIGTIFFSSSSLDACVSIHEVVPIHPHDVSTISCTGSHIY